MSAIHFGSGRGFGVANAMKSLSKATVPSKTYIVSHAVMQRYFGQNVLQHMCFKIHTDMHQVHVVMVNMYHYGPCCLE